MILPLPATSKKSKEFGLKHYFTGSLCPRGHLSLRLASTRACMACSKEKAKDNYPSLAKKYKDDESYREARLASNRKWSNANKEKHAEMIKSWVENNRERFNKNQNRRRSERRESDPNYLIRERLRSMIRRNANDCATHGDVNFRINDALGYSCEDLKSHIEKQFTEGMSWSNYSEWHIDHIIPLAAMVNSGVSDPKAMHCLSNLRPIWAKENQSKSDNIEFLL